MKKCFKCEEVKPLNAFYRHKMMSDGRLGKCKDCTKADTKKNRENKLEYYREYDRKRGCRHAKGYGERYYRSSPIKGQAHNRASRAERKGLIERPDSCEQCGSSRFKLHAHHDDYLKQLNVRWLCPGCHHQWHARHGEADNANHPPLPRSKAVTDQQLAYLQKEA